MTYLEICNVPYVISLSEDVFTCLNKPHNFLFHVSLQTTQKQRTASGIFEAIVTWITSAKMYVVEGESFSKFAQ